LSISNGSLAVLARCGYRTNDGLQLFQPDQRAPVASCFQVIGLPIYSLGTQIKDNQGRASWFDYPLTWAWVFILVVSILVWFVVVVPVQYAVYSVCGAPIRFMLASDRVAIARFAGSQLHPDEIDKKEPLPEGWKNVSITNSPLSMTNVLAALLFGILQAFVN
jgi:hypothetical protein